jgi:hypothetical protein
MNPGVSRLEVIDALARRYRDLRDAERVRHVESVRGA